MKHSEQFTLIHPPGEERLTAPFFLPYYTGTCIRDPTKFVTFMYLHVCLLLDYKQPEGMDYNLIIQGQ